METKPVRLTKKHYACYAILNAGRPLTRLETMSATHTFQSLAGCKVAPFCPTSNVSYWLPQVSPFCSASRSSFLVQGLLRQVGKRKNAHTYELTPAGQELALQVQAHLETVGEFDSRPIETIPEDHYAL